MLPLLALPRELDLSTREWTLIATISAVACAILAVGLLWAIRRQRQRIASSSDLLCVEGLQCPACNARFSMLAVLRSPWPLSAKCRSCNAKCLIDMPGMPGLAVVASVIVFVTVLASFAADERYGEAAGWGLVFGVAVAFELAAFWIYSRRARLWARATL